MANTIKTTKKRFQRLFYILHPWLKQTKKISNYSKICNMDYNKINNAKNKLTQWPTINLNK